MGSPGSLTPHSSADRRVLLIHQKVDLEETEEDVTPEHLHTIGAVATYHRIL